MPWYYSDGNQQLGPVSDEEFARMTASGSIGPATLVWSPGMDQWRPYGELTRPAGASAPPPPPPAAPGGEGAAPAQRLFCSECGGLFPEDNLIAYQDRRVCAGCKPAFFQRIKEGLSVGGAMDYAGFWIRFVAKIADGFLLWIVQQGAAAVVLTGSGAPETSEQVFAQLGLALGLNVAIACSYAVFFNGRYGATPGKMMLKLKIVTPEGEPISYGKAAGRYFAEILSGMFLFIGYIMAGSDEEKRTLHDRICNTRVIRKPS